MMFGLRHQEWKQSDSSYANIVMEECKILAASMLGIGNVSAAMRNA